MIELVKIDLEKFKEKIYPKYLKIFPANERKSYKQFVTTFNNGILNIIEIILKDKSIGFILTNSIKENKYLQVYYFAIFPKFQGKGYGKQAINILKQISSEYKGIFIEIEKLGLGKDDEENMLRKRRMKFYTELGFIALNYDFNLFEVIYTPLVLPIQDELDEQEKIVQDIIKIYYEILGEEIYKNNCSIEKTLHNVENVTFL